MRSIFIVFFLIGLVLSGCNENIYPTSSVVEQIPIETLGKIIEYEKQNNISYKGFVGCNNFYDLYNLLNNKKTEIKSADKALLTNITYRDCVDASRTYAKYLDSMDSISAIDATEKDYPVVFCFLMGGDWQSLILGKD